MIGALAVSRGITRGNGSFARRNSRSRSSPPRIVAREIFARAVGNAPESTRGRIVLKWNYQLNCYDTASYSVLLVAGGLFNRNDLETVNFIIFASQS